MLSSVHELAPAKLNIGLRVLPKRSDGFHGIESIFQKIHLCDELTVTLDGNNQSTHNCALTVHGMMLPKENTLTKAYELFCAETGLHPSVQVQLTKRIPSGAGMGGGSSDAVAMLRCLQRLCNVNLSNAVLHNMTCKIGSDVPFFIGSSCAIVSGRGEVMSAVASRKDICFVIVCPSVHSSTKEAYNLVDEWYAARHKDAEQNWLALNNLEQMYRKPIDEWQFKNSFTAPLVKQYPQIGFALSAVQETGACFCDMTGSGSAVYGVYNSLKDAECAFAKLTKQQNQCFVAPVFDE